MSENLYWKLNTGNVGKLQEFQRLFAKHGKRLISTQIDLKEIEADPLTVVTHKASQLEELTLIEDTSLEIEGFSMGVNVKWLMDHLTHLIGRKAVWIVFLAYRSGDEVIIYKGEVTGQIVESRGKGGFGFDPFFLPEGAKDTLAQSKPDQFNARARAVEALIKDEKYACVRAIYDWDGPWQPTYTAGR